MENLDKFKIIVKKGVVIFPEFAIGEELYYILDGKIKISKISKGSEKVLAYLEKGEFFGEMSVFQGLRRSATAIAEEESILLKLNKENFFKLMETEEKIIFNFIKTLSLRYILTQKQLNSLLNKNNERNILEFIHDRYIKINKNVREIRIKKSEISSLLNINEAEIRNNLLYYYKLGKLKDFEDEIVVYNFEWLDNIIKYGKKYVKNL